MAKQLQLSEGNTRSLDTDAQSESIECEPSHKQKEKKKRKKRQGEGGATSPQLLYLPEGICWAYVS